MHHNASTLTTEVEGGDIDVDRMKDGDFSDGDASDMEELLQIDCAAGGVVLNAPFWTIHVDRYTDQTVVSPAPVEATRVMKLDLCQGGVGRWLSAIVRAWVCVSGWGGE